MVWVMCQLPLLNGFNFISVPMCTFPDLKHNYPSDPQILYVVKLFLSQKYDTKMCMLGKCV